MPESVAKISGPQGGYEQVRYANDAQHIYELGENSDGSQSHKHISTDNFLSEMARERQVATPVDSVEPSPAPMAPADQQVSTGFSGISIPGEVTGSNVNINNNGGNQMVASPTITIGGPYETTTPVRTLGSLPSHERPSAGPAVAVAERPGSNPNRDAVIAELRDRLRAQDQRIDGIVSELAQANQLLAQIVTMMAERMNSAGPGNPEPAPEPEPEPPVPSPEPDSAPTSSMESTFEELAKRGQLPTAYQYRVEARANELGVSVGKLPSSEFESIARQLEEESEIIPDAYSEPEPASFPEPEPTPEPAASEQTQEEPYPFLDEDGHTSPPIEFDWGDDKGNTSKPRLRDRIKSSLRSTFVEPKPMPDLVVPEPDPVHLPMMDRVGEAPDESIRRRAQQIRGRLRSGDDTTNTGGNA